MTAATERVIGPIFFLSLGFGFLYIIWQRWFEPSRMDILLDALCPTEPDPNSSLAWRRQVYLGWAPVDLAGCYMLHGADTFLSYPMRNWSIDFFGSLASTMVPLLIDCAQIFPDNRGWLVFSAWFISAQSVQFGIGIAPAFYWALSI
jgi:hypothetical protein